MTEAQLDAQFNADSNGCIDCPHRTDACHRDGCLIPVTTLDDEEATCD